VRCPGGIGMEGWAEELVDVWRIIRKFWRYKRGRGERTCVTFVEYY